MSREMKDSGVEWIGEIPEDWEIIPNKHLMKKVKNLCPVYNGEDILSLSMKGVYVRDPNDESGKRPTTYNGYQYVQEGDLLMCLFDIDVTPRCVGRVYNNGLTSPAYSRFVMNKTRAIVDYYYYYYLALDFDKTLLHLSKNMRSSLTESDFGSINAPVPSPTEQQQIVHFLDRKCTAIDTAIEKTKKSIEKLEEYKKAVITKAVTKGIDPNAKMKDSGVEWIGEIPEGWEITRNKFYVIISHGMEPKTEGDIPVYGSGAESFKTCGEYKKGPAVLLGRKGTLHIPHYITGKYWNVDTAFDVKPKSEDMGLKYFYFLSMCFNYNYYIAKTTLPSMTQFDYCNMRIPLPSRTEQDLIVSYIEDKCVAIDTAIEKKKKAIEKWEEYKKSLIYYTVTGKIDCRNEVI